MRNRLRIDNPDSRYHWLYQQRCNRLFGLIISITLLCAYVACSESIAIGVLTLARGLTVVVVFSAASAFILFIAYVLYLWIWTSKGLSL